MKITFEPAPAWMPEKDCHCRYCDKSTQFVMSAGRYSFTFPCCDDPVCQSRVETKIRLVIRSRIKGFRRKLSILFRWWRIMQASHHQQDRELMRANLRLWGSMRGFDH